MLRPFPPTPADSRILGFCYFSGNVYFANFPLGFRVWEGLQSIGNGCGLQMDEFSAHFEPSEFIFNDFHDFGHFGGDSGGLLLLPEGPRSLRDCPEGPGTPSEGPVRMCYDGLMPLPEGSRTRQDCPDGRRTLSGCPAQLVCSSRN